MKSANEWTAVPQIDSKYYPELRAALRDWWREQGRRFPWRAQNNPYAIFLAEVILQKTQVAKAERAYYELVTAYPTIIALAQAPLSHLEGIFTWLGLRKRARFLLSAAQQIAERHQGVMPRERKLLKQLPGIGDYTANAILCFAYQQPLPIVDTTIARVLKRLLGFHSARSPWEDPIAWRIAGEFLDVERPVEHNYALLDLAALICVENPKCSICPLKSWCSYYKTIHL